MLLVTGHGAIHGHINELGCFDGWGRLEETP